MALAAVAKPAPPPRNASAEIAAGFTAYRDGSYANAARLLGGTVGKGLPIDDWLLFLAGESQFYEGDFAGARARFEKVARVRGAGGGRPGQMAPWRVADCLWMEGDHARAAAAYAKLVTHAGAWGDAALARFRIAEVTAARNPAEAQRQWLLVAREFPAHPLADEALRRSVAAPPSTGKAGAPPPTLAIAPQERLKRAETLTRDRHWNEALNELALLPGDLPPELGAERDFQIGETKFHMRRDYSKAAELLLAVAPRLSGDKAATAAFHGARALSRIDRDDEAIAGYRKVIDTYPHSRFAAEAQYLSGWLDYNRGRFRESLPALQTTLDHYGKSPFADDAAWCLAFAHYLLGDSAAALSGFARYAALASNDMPAEDRAARVAYWRARVAERSGRTDEARAAYRQLGRRPFSFYGLLARARLKAAGESMPLDLPPPHAVSASGDAAARALAPLPELARARELLAAHMDVEAGWEAERSEKDVLKRLGAAAGLSTMLDVYRRGQNFHRAYQLAEGRGGDALGTLPQAAARPVWEAAYPRAFAELVEKFGPGAGNPDLFLYAIMRKESGFSPGDVSFADARGLLQMIPPTSARVAAASGGVPFFPDQLFEPATNVRLGASYIGALFRKFGEQVPLAAGAYNAGPRAMTRWCDQHAAHPTDEFVELIAFSATREYVKRVSAIYARYRFLYGPTPFELPLTLDLHYRADGPDY